MNRSELVNGIHRSWQFFEKNDFGGSFSQPNSLEVNVEFRDAVLSKGTRYTDLYLLGLRLSHYNFVLGDNSFFQFSISSDHEVRYAYYPNPFIGLDASEMDRLLIALEGGVLNAEEFSLIISSKQPELRIPIIRYENSREQYKEIAHPCSHFHIGLHSENRWPVSRVVTPFAFCLLISKCYYKSIWDKSKDDQCEFLNLNDEAYAKEKQASRILGEELFSKKEARLFHFT